MALNGKRLCHKEIDTCRTVPLNSTSLKSVAGVVGVEVGAEGRSGLQWHGVDPVL